MIVVTYFDDLKLLSVKGFIEALEDNNRCREFATQPKHWRSYFVNGIKIK
jgi:hypothetical protein